MNEFLHPEFLAWRPWVLVLAGLHALLGLQQWWWQKRQFSPAMLKAYGPGLALWRGLLKSVLWGAAGWWLCLALAVPQGPPELVEQGEAGADLILAVDVSSSMLAQDIAPNRLEALKSSLAGLLEGLDGDRVGLVAFAGEAVVACPLTTDLDTALLFLSKLDPDSVPRDGTGLGPALAMAQDGFKNSGTRGRMIVLATDGEDTANSDALAEAERLKQAGIAFLCVGMGSTKGAMIPGRRDVFGRVFAKTYQGQPVITRLDRAGLQKVAAAGGGEYMEAKDNRSLGSVAPKLRALKQGVGQVHTRSIREPLYQYPLLWALALLLIESLISARARGLLRLIPRGVLVLACLPLSLHASWWDQGRKDYNGGNQAFRQKDYQGAVGRYESSLKDRPGAEDAEANLALAKRMLEKQQQESQEQKDQKEGDKKGQDKKGQGKNGKPQPGQGRGQSRAQAALNNDKAQAMMNKLRLDQRNFSGAFNPLKKRKPKQEKDPAEQAFEELTGMRMNPKEPEQGADSNVKDW